MIRHPSAPRRRCLSLPAPRIVKTRRLTCLKCGKVVRISLSAGTLGRDFQVVRELGGWIVRSLDRLPDDLLLTRCLVGSVEEHDL